MQETNFLLFYAGLFSIFMIEEGTKVHKFAEKDKLFNFVFIFVSVLSFIRNVQITIVLMLLYFSVKYAFAPILKTYFRKVRPLDDTLSFDSRQPWLNNDVCPGGLWSYIRAITEDIFPNLLRSIYSLKLSKFYCHPRFHILKFHSCCLFSNLNRGWCWFPLSFAHTLRKLRILPFTWHRERKKVEIFGSE